jgi:pyridinium-3,5-bisthiocarboxylic acid mononucleotide nickel chelatase
MVSGIGAWKFDVSLEEVGTSGRTSPHDPHSRHLSEINTIIDKAKIEPRAKDLAKKIFDRLAEAEAKVHKSTKEAVHFHEVGAWDSITDIVCAAASFVRIDADRIISSPFQLEAGGTVKTMHGVLACPVPAVLELVKGFPCRTIDIKTEITTPTGAAILTVLADEFGILPGGYIIEENSYGAGTKKLEIPNFLRMLLVQTEKESHQGMYVIETNIDDMNPQLMPDVLDDLLKLGCAEAYWSSIFMKKGRPGFLLTVLADGSKLQPAIDFILKNTTTIGVRYHPVDRRCLERTVETRKTEFGEIRFKTVTLPDGTKRSQPEFEDVRRVAGEKKIPQMEIIRKIQE